MVPGTSTEEYFVLIHVDGFALNPQTSFGFRSISEAPPLPSATTAPRPRHTAALGATGEITGAASRPRRAGCVGRRPPGDGLLGPLERRGSPGRVGFP